MSDVGTGAQGLISWTNTTRLRVIVDPLAGASCLYCEHQIVADRSADRSATIDGVIGDEQKRFVLVLRTSQFKTDRTLDDFFDDFAVDLGESFFAAEVREGEFVLIDSELMQHGRVNVTKVIGTLNRTQANLIGFSDDLATADSSASHPHGESQVVVIASLARLRLW